MTDALCMHERQPVVKAPKALQNPISEVEIWRAVCEIIAGSNVFETLKRCFEITLCYQMEEMPTVSPWVYDPIILMT